MIVNVEKGKLLKTKTYTASVSGTISSGTNSSVTVSVTQISGYTPVAIVGHYINSWAIATYNARFTNGGTEVRIDYKNISNVLVTSPTLYCIVLYAKTDEFTEL